MATWNKTDTETKEEIAQQEQKDKCECSNKIEKLEQQIKDFYEDSYIEPNESLIDKLEFDMEYVRLI